MALLDAGYPCSIRDQLHVHPTSVAAFSLVFKDLRILYQALGFVHSVLLVYCHCVAGNVARQCVVNTHEASTTLCLLESCV